MNAVTDLDTVIDLYKWHNHLSVEDIEGLLSQLQDPVFSARMMEKVTELPMPVVLNAMDKRTKTGGRLNPETLETIRDLRDHGFNKADVIWVLEKGTSQNLLARLTGISQSKISRAWRQHRAAESHK